MADGIKLYKAGSRVPGYLKPVTRLELLSVSKERRMRAERKRDAEEVEKKKWVDGLEGRNFTCEHQVDRTKMGTHPIIEVINRQGLQFFFSPIKGFKPNREQNGNHKP